MARPGRKKQTYGDGRMSENRIAWLRVIIGQFVIMRDNGSDEDIVKEFGPTYRLYLPRPGARAMSFNITALTHEEFLALKEMFQYLFDISEPIILERDRIANAAFDKGDDSFARSYRQIPQLIIRERKVGKDGQGLHERPVDLPDGDESEAEEVGEVRMSDGGVRGAGNELASGKSEAAVSKDDDTKTY